MMMVTLKYAKIKIHNNPGLLKAQHVQAVHSTYKLQIQQVCVVVVVAGREKVTRTKRLLHDGCATVTRCCPFMNTGRLRMWLCPRKSWLGLGPNRTLEPQLQTTPRHPCKTSNTGFFEDVYAICKYFKNYMYIQQ